MKNKVIVKSEYNQTIDIKRDKKNKFQIKLNDKNYKVLTIKQSEKLYARLNNGLKERNSLMKKQW